MGDRTKPKIWPVILGFLLWIACTPAAAKAATYYVNPGESIQATFDAPPVLWEKTFGGSSSDEGWSVQQTVDGGFVIAGGTSSFGAGGEDVYLVKTDSEGNLLWQKTFGGSSGDSAHSVEQTTDGGFIIAGYTGSFGAGEADVYLIKTDPNGEMLWQNTFGGSKWDYGYSVQQTTDGGYIIAGNTSSFSVSYDVAIYLIKTDSAGNMQWQKTIGGGDSDFGKSVQQTIDGGYIIAGWTHVGFAEDLYLIKTDSAGNSQWQKTFGCSGLSASVQQTTDGDFIIAGGGVYLMKTDSAGNLLWEKTFGGSNCYFGKSFQQTSDGGYIIAGGTYPCSEDDDSSDVYLVKTDSEGNLLWEKTFGGNNGGDMARSVQQTTDGGYIIAGWTKSFGSGRADVYLIKLGFEGRTLYVDDDAPNDPGPGDSNVSDPLEDGSQAHPFDAIQEAIDTAGYGGETIIVLDGLYTGEGNRDLDFTGKAITVCSETGPENCIIDCNGTKIDRHRGFYFHSGEDANSILNGFTIVNGYSDKGGGIYCQESSPTITNCTITGNSVEWLGRTGGYGGGMHNIRSSPTVTNCTFSGNSAINGGGMYNSGSSPTVTNCVFSGNEANYGGGMANESSSSPTVTNCTFTGNEANYGGGMCNTRSSTPTVTNCTFSGNSATNYGGGMYNGGSNPTVTNCILWGNLPDEIYVSSGTPVVTYSDVVKKSWPGEGNINVDPCFVEAGYWADVNDPDIIVEPDDPNAIWVDGDYHLKSEGWRWYADRNTWAWDDVTSPCIDAGNPGSPLGDEPLAILDDPYNEWGQNLRINMGAYGGTAEASMPPYEWALLADLTNDGIVDFADLANWSEDRLRSGNDRPSNLDRNAIVNIIDFAWLAQDWLAETSWSSLLPGQASNPTPADGSTGVYWYLDLSWSAGSYATSRDVYFGTSSPPSFIGNQVSTIFDPGGLASDTHYFWRIDEVNRNGTTTGTAWSFTTTTGGNPKPRGCFPADTGVWVDGVLVQISKVIPGQKVGKASNALAAMCLHEVERVVEHDESEGPAVCYDIVLESGNRISVVDCHYFLVDSGRWVAVQNLRSGSKLMSLNGPITVSRIVKRAVPFVGKCYNLKIKGSERYFIGKDAVIVRDW